LTAPRVIVVGGGAAGFFAAIACAEANPGAEVTILEKSAHFLGKVRISGGGRCNVTHACFDPTELTTRFPRGERALRAPFNTFQSRDTVEWFESRGVKLKTENDGRMFPTTDSSLTIIECLTRAATAAGVKLRTNSSVARITKQTSGGFEVSIAGGESLVCDRVLLATGGCRAAAAGELAASLGHTFEAPVPSLFTFHVESKWVRELSGVSVAIVAASVPGTKLREQGPLLLTHWGLSGPVILRLSAWGARILDALNYQFVLRLNWLPKLDAPGTAEPAHYQHTAAAVARAALGTIGVGRRDCERNTMGGAFKNRATRADPATHPHGIQSNRQEPEQGRIRHMRRRAAGRSGF
jgi:hypothetical protein